MSRPRFIIGRCEDLRLREPGYGENGLYDIRVRDYRIVHGVEDRIITISLLQ